MNAATEAKLLSLLALAASVNPRTEVLAHLNAMNLQLVIASPDAGALWSEAERATALSAVFTVWPCLCRAMVRLEEAHPLAAENGVQTAQRIFDLWKLNGDAR